MPKQIIALDLDDVLAANAQTFIDFSNGRWHTELTMEDFQEDFRTMWGVDHHEVERRMVEFADLGIVADYPHFQDAVPVVHKLAETYELVIVTSRRNALKAHTEVWLEQYFGKVFKSIRHAGFFDNIADKSYQLTKAEICRELGADYLIDDQLKHCLAAAEAGIESLLFGDYSWNRADKLPKVVTRVNSWADVEAYFDEKSR